MPRSSIPTPPSSSPPRALSPNGSGPHPQQRPPTFYKGDEHILNRIPSYTPMTEAELHYHMKLIHPDANDDNMHTYIARLNRQVDKVMERSGLLVIGEKPRPDDKNYYALAVPNSNYIIRIWDGGMTTYSQFCLDFFDTSLNSPVNLPQGYTLWPAPNQRMPVYMMHGPLVSWERAMGCTDIPNGEEKWSVPEGLFIYIQRAQEEDFTFAVPSRTPAMPATILQPTYLS
ncbi:hypothetical protein EWM64_g5816 [Hericium alpestre]|uniref:Uncharacterized protein n=1 Tax=Hericium alpestre TaxID=135208 RepID=A0A4Y9ZVK9_9AGAM|nr:hypothetical protein EWM64_g5816 [Hericium alpestre]